MYIYIYICSEYVIYNNCFFGLKPSIPKRESCMVWGFGFRVPSSSPAFDTCPFPTLTPHLHWLTDLSEAQSPGSKILFRHTDAKLNQVKIRLERVTYGLIHALAVMAASARLLSVAVCCTQRAFRWLAV